MSLIYPKEIFDYLENGANKLQLHDKIAIDS